ncbi:MAG: helix-turn-helix transcriptional regulator [Alphaproteobacteria bacterium]|nr:helix-turn-helix transcriptional regulator [Alphaproteobacteria bacterium]
MKYNCQLCYSIGVSESTLSRWRMGRPLSLKHAVALSYNLGISLDHLLTGSSPQEQDETFSRQISKLCDTYSRLNAQNQNLSLNLLRRLASRSDAAGADPETGGPEPEAGE